VKLENQIAESEKHYFPFLSLFNNNEVLISHFDNLTQGTIIDIIKQTSQLPFFVNAHISFKNTFRSIVIEMLQNVLKHGAESNKNLIILAIKGDMCYLYSANYVTKEEADKLEKGVAALDQLSTEELDEKFKYGVTNNEIYGNGNAGLGLIEIIRKSIRPIQYKVIRTPNGNGYFNFVIHMKIKAK
jgi:Family of unknown function (DUF6272)